MSNTKDKLLEAKYFLDQMIKNQSKRYAFRYNLSAFLSAARSVTSFMQKEYDKVNGFKEWHEEKRAKTQSDDKFRFFNKKRVMTIHKQPVIPHANIGIGISSQLYTSESVSVVVVHANGTKEKRETGAIPSPVPTKDKMTVKWLWYFDEIPENDVVTVCNEHITKLETIVAECESIFTC